MKGIVTIMNVLNKYKKEFRFLIIGGISTTIDFIFYMLLSQKIDITLAKLISMILATTFSYIFNKNWTFSVKEKTHALLIVKYIGCQIINILCNTITNTIVYKLTNLKIISFILATCLAMIVNFLLQKTVVFKK